MKKQIHTIGYEIPGYSKTYTDFGSSRSLMDADILLISPELFDPDGHWIDFSSGGGCYDLSASSRYEQQVSSLKKEIGDFLTSGKNVFLFLSEITSHTLATGVSHPRKGENSYSTRTGTNYDFLPISIGALTSASGKRIEFSGNSIFSDFYRTFKENLEYQLYAENLEKAQIIFTGKDNTKILGAVYKVGNGHLITLPFLKYDEDKFLKYKKGDKETGYWTTEAIKFGKKLSECLVNIDQQLTQKSEKTPTLGWVKQEIFSTKKAQSIKRTIQKNKQKIEEIKSKNVQLCQQLSEEQVLRDLLFEQGKPLENAVIKALNILGYQAENYDDGELELDQVIVSPEKYRFVGECEGKDSKDINITKYRQLLESLSADFARDEVEEKAYGILFGNPQRLLDPNERTLDFTKKCKIGAGRDKIALVKTTDLFVVAKYLKENKNEKYKKACRNAIYNGLGKIVEFPETPKKI